MRLISWSVSHFPEHLYVHWPFCARRCSYCDFVALERHERFIQRYYAALCGELTRFADQFNSDRRLKSLYIGGGTPSLWPLQMLSGFFQEVGRVLSFAPFAEVTLEVNPSNITSKHLDVWRECGINRLSFGVQVLDDRVNSLLNRIQISEEVESTIERAARLFDNLSVDLIVGLPEVSEEVWNKTLDRVLSWPIKHISLYLLTIFENTPLYHAVRRGRIKVPSDEEVICQFERSCARLSSAGFKRYEISNFAKVGYTSRHNEAYWKLVPYKGIGLAASSFDGRVRSTNEQNLNLYLDRAESGRISRGSGGFKEERLTPLQRRTECIMLGLRQSCGILFKALNIGSRECSQTFLNELFEMEQAGLLKYDEERFLLTSRGMLVESEVSLRLLNCLGSDNTSDQFIG